MAYISWTDRGGYGRFLGGGCENLSRVSRGPASPEPSIFMSSRRTLFHRPPLLVVAEESFFLTLALASAPPHRLLSPSHHPYPQTPRPERRTENSRPFRFHLAARTSVPSPFPFPFHVSAPPPRHLTIGRILRSPRSQNRNHPTAQTALGPWCGPQPISAQLSSAAHPDLSLKPPVSSPKPPVSSPKPQSPAQPPALPSVKTATIPQ